MNLYDILGVQKNTTQEHIKKAHRRLVKKLHPDIGGDPQRFAEVQVAYEVLSDKALREEYDKTGEIPKRNPNNILPQSYELFFRLFVTVVQQTIQQGKDPEQIDLVSAIERKANEMLEKEVNEGIKNLTNTNKILKKMIERFKSKVKGKEPFSHSILRNAIQQNEGGIKNLENQRIIINNLVLMLDELVFDVKRSEARVTSSTTSSYWFKF